MTHLTRSLALAAAAAVAAAAAEEAAASSCPSTASTCEEAAAEPDTSLLQHRLQMEPAPGVFPTFPSAADARDFFADIPEAASAWALWQPVADGAADPSKLGNTTTEFPLPGTKFPGEATLMKGLATTMGFGFVRPDGLSDKSPDWAVACLGRDYRLVPVSSWTLNVVTTPQMVPFVVPMDQPGRTDVSIVIAPGGGGMVLDWEIEGTDIAKSFNSMGISAFVLKYRVPITAWGMSPEIMDAQRALGLIRHHATALGLNASRVGMFGASHGGVTATFTSFATKRLYERRDAADDLNLKPDFWILLYPQLMVDEFAKAAEGPHTYGDIELNGLASAPPTFIAAGENDNCCKVEIMYAFHELLKLYTEAPVEVNVFSDVGHYWATCFRRGIEIMMHEACLWMLRARHFIMWNVEGKVPSEIDAVYQETIKYINPLLVRNVSS